jgi:fatty acid desaturase
MSNCSTDLISRSSSAIPTTSISEPSLSNSNALVESSYQESQAPDSSSDKSSKARKSKRFSKDILSEFKRLGCFIKDNYTNFVYIILDYLWILASVIVALQVHLTPELYIPLVYLPLLVIIGSRMRGLENLSHEASHGLLFSNRKLNDWVGSLFCASPVLIILSVFRWFHKQHHIYLGDSSKDPDLKRLLKKDLVKDVSSQKLKNVLLGMFSPINTVIYLKELLPYSGSTKDVQVSDRFTRAFFWLVVLLIVALSNSWLIFFLFWVVPFLTSFQIIRAFAEISEHCGLYENTDAVNMTRSSLVNPITRFVLYPHGDNYHLVHHLLDSIPHYNLHKAHKILMQDKDYQQAHHCYGYFFTFKEQKLCTLKDMVNNP